MCVQTHTHGNKKTIVYFHLAFEDVTDPIDLVSGLCLPIVPSLMDWAGGDRKGGTAGVLGLWGSGPEPSYPPFPFTVLVPPLCLWLVAATVTDGATPSEVSLLCTCHFSLSPPELVGNPSLHFKMKIFTQKISAPSGGTFHGCGDYPVVWWSLHYW